MATCTAVGEHAFVVSYPAEACADTRAARVVSEVIRRWQWVDTDVADMSGEVLHFTVLTGEDGHRVDLAAIGWRAVRFRGRYVVDLDDAAQKHRALLLRDLFRDVVREGRR